VGNFSDRDRGNSKIGGTAIEPVFTEPERLALAGFLAGYTGLTREASGSRRSARR
jgi:hypothetical protein